VSTVGLLAGQNQLLAYFVIYLAVILLGNVSSFASFWIVFRGYLGVWGVPLLILTIFLANITGDLLWYALGHTTRNTGFGNWIRRHLPKWHDRIERAFESNGRKWIVLSKFMYAAAFPVIFSAGWSQMAFKRFFRNSLISVLAWLPILLGLAYGLFSGLSPLGTVSVFHDFEVLFIIGLGLFILFDYFLARFIGRIFGENGEVNIKSVD
jgi:membrane protein DedA with SNARE-associated domain